MKKLLTTALILSAMFATAQKRLVMDKTTIDTIKDGRIKITTKNYEIDSIMQVQLKSHWLSIERHYGKGSVNIGDNYTRLAHSATYYFQRSDTALLNRFFDRMNKK